MASPKNSGNTMTKLNNEIRELNIDEISEVPSGMRLEFGVARSPVT
jgi:hypothetical protein